MKIKQGMEREYAEYVATNSSDGYSKGVVDYVERWAEAMEQHMDRLGSEEATRFITANAQRLSHEADIDGITGFMYGCAVQALARFWVYGEELRRWHNLETQMHHEGERANESGGVLNPALINIGV